MTMIILASVLGFVCGVVLGLILVFVIHKERIKYHIWRECRMCRRKMVEFGFYFDGQKYKCIER